MGLADRFKDKLAAKDIFKQNEIEKELEYKDIQFISKPITENIIVQPKVIHSTQDGKIENIMDISREIPEEWISDSPAKFEELETEIINKIRKTPYWQEYSSNKQENMISKYFDKKIQRDKYSSIEYTIKDKLDFIENILALSNSK